MSIGSRILRVLRAVPSVAIFSLGVADVTVKIDRTRFEASMGMFRYRFRLMGFSAELSREYSVVVQKEDGSYEGLIKRVNLGPGFEAIEKRMTAEVPKEVCVTASYLKERWKRTTYVAGVCAFGIIACIATAIVGYPASPWPVVLLLVIGAAPFADLLLAKYRYENGFFGNNEREARDIVGYIIANSDKFDSDDGNFKVFEDDMRRVQAWSLAGAIAGQTA